MSRLKCTSQLVPVKEGLEQGQFESCQRHEVNAQIDFVPRRGRNSSYEKDHNRALNVSLQFDRFVQYLESRSPFEDSEQLRSAYEILLGEKLDSELPTMKAALMIVRRRLAAAIEKVEEPTSKDLEQFEELVERRVKGISRLAVWKTLKNDVAALIPRRHGYGPARTIGESDFPKVIAAVEGLESKHPEWKREAVYEEVGKKFGASWRTIQDAYLEAKRRQSPKAT